MRAKHLLKLIPVCGLTLATALSSQAQLITNADTSATLSPGSAWEGGVAPGAANIAVWNDIVQINTNVTLGAAESWAGIQILDPAGPINIAADGNSLTLGASGIDLSQATNGLTLGCPVVLGGKQTWMVTNGMTLSTLGVVSGSGLLILNNGGNNNGTINITNSNTYTGGTVINSGTVAINSQTSLGASASAVTNNGGMLELVNFFHAGVMVNAFTVTGTSLIDMAGQGQSYVFDGAWSGNGTILVTNDTGSGSTLTFGGATGGTMGNFTGTITVVDNASATPSAGTIRFNNGGTQNNKGNSAMTVNLGGTNPGSPGSAVRLGNRESGTTSLGQVTGGVGTELVGPTGQASTTATWSIGGLNTSFTFGGAFANASGNEICALTKVGTGTMTLTSISNTLASGATTISAGTLQVGDGNADGTLLAGAIANNAALVFNRPDSYVVSNNISGGGSITIQDGGTLNYLGTNSSSGTTIISQGDLVLAASGLMSGPIAVGSAGTFDISQNPTFTLKQNLSGSGTVTGLLTAVSGSISPGGSGTSGTLTLQSGLTESGSFNNQFVLSTPTGTNDFLNVVGNLTLSGVNNLILSTFGGGTVPVGTYPLIAYSGTLSGGTANFAVVAAGVNGIVTNITSVSPPEIAVIITPALRGPTNMIWKGDGVLNNWDNTSSNWFNGPTSFAFQDGDSVIFNDLGSPNTNVNLAVTALPGSVTFSNSVHYTVSGSGSIGGSTGLVKTNSGTLTMLTINSYTGPTIVGQGVLEVTNVGISGVASGIGEANGNATNLVFSGSTFKYSGPSGNTDHGATFNGSGATFDVTNGTTLTLNGILTGAGALDLIDSGTLVLNNDNTYTGGTVISNGILAMGSNNANNNGSGGSAVGPTNEPVIFAGGTLQLFGYGLSDTPNYNTFMNPLVVPAGQSGTLLMFPRGPINTGGGAGLFSSLSGSGTLNLVVNYVRDALSGDWSAFSGVINVTNSTSAGPWEFRINNNFGYANATINLESGVIMDSTLTVGATINIGALNGVTNAIIGQGNASAGGPTWSIGWNNLSSTYGGIIEDDTNSDLTGHTSLVKVGTGTLTLQGGFITITEGSGVLITTVTIATNLLDYTGSTTVSNGVLALIVPDNLTASTNVTLASSAATIDASQMGFVDDTGTNVFTNSTFEAVSGQSLNGIGTLIGNLQADAGSTFNVGFPTGTFNITTNASLSGAVVMNLNGTASSELAAQSFTINNASATLLVTNIGANIVNGTTFTLFNQGVSGFASVTLPATDPTKLINYSWLNNLAVNGTITLTNSVATTAPKISLSVSGNTLSLSWPSANLGYTLQVQTNSLSVGVSTNWVNVPGSTSVTSTNITIDPSSPSVFFRLHP